MIPGRGQNNIQRRIYTRILEQRPNPPAPGLETDWELLLLAGHNGIGHLDIFRDDRVAENYYTHRGDSFHHPAAGDRSKFWAFLRENLQGEVVDLDAADIAEILGPTPSVGGMIPKVLVAIPEGAGWNGSFAAPGTTEINGTPYLDVVLKIEPMEYQGVLALEALCLDWHRRLDFEVPRFWQCEQDGMRLLAIERFDRTPEHRPIPLESLFSLFAIGDREFQETADIDMDELGRRIEVLGEVIHLDVRATQREIYRRFVLAFFTGNGDMHLENLSLLGGPEQARLAPVYDPAPMRAWPRHNTRSAIPLSFEGTKGMGEVLLKLAASFGVSTSHAKELISTTLEATEAYLEALQQLPDVPANRIKYLLGVLTREREQFSLPTIF